AAPVLNRARVRAGCSENYSHGQSLFAFNEGMRF
ncbi:hypothetical protein Pgy4_41824, partial [Pseudomonas savastanoi pv. glycinea str. race 4]